MYVHTCKPANTQYRKDFMKAHLHFFDVHVGMSIQRIIEFSDFDYLKYLHTYVHNTACGPMYSFLNCRG
jgi:hypothetical protein